MKNKTLLVDDNYYLDRDSNGEYSVHYAETKLAKFKSLNKAIILFAQKVNKPVKTVKILVNIQLDDEIQKGLNKLNHYSKDGFFDACERYIKAIKEGRMICSIGSVSSSGMSRTIKFMECSKQRPSEYRYYNFWSLFKVLGYPEARNKNDYFSISGCGMDMIFHTNYSIIHRLQRLGFINRKQCDSLAQMTPPVI